MQFPYLSTLLFALSVFALDQVPLGTNTVDDCGRFGICPPPGTLGLQYGKCYTMVDTNRRPIQRLDTQYVMDGTVNGFKALVFRICNSTSNCNQAQNEWVPEGGSWYQLDQMGYRDLPAPGWLGHSGYLWYLTDIKDNPSQALRFTAKSTYILGGYALCLRLAAKAYGDWMGTANLGGADALSIALNPNTCRPFYYESTTCLTEYGAPWVN